MEVNETSPVEGAQEQQPVEPQCGNAEEQAEDVVEYSSDMLEGKTNEEICDFFETYGKSVYNRDFDKKLTDEELSDMKDEIYQLNDKLMTTNEEKASVTKQYSDKIKSLQTQMNTLTSNVKMGTKPVYEPCVKVLDLKGKHVYFFAQSTGQCVFVRGILGEDLEQTFPFETVYNVIDGDGEKVQLVISRHGGLPEVDDKTSNEDGDYTMDDGSLITVEKGMIINIEEPSTDEGDEEDDGNQEEDNLDE